MLYALIVLIAGNGLTAWRLSGLTKESELKAGVLTLYTEHDEKISKQRTIMNTIQHCSVEYFSCLGRDYSGLLYEVQSSFYSIQELMSEVRTLIAEDTFDSLRTAEAILLTASGRLTPENDKGLLNTAKYQPYARWESEVEQRLQIAGTELQKVIAARKERNLLAAKVNS